MVPLPRAADKNSQVEKDQILKCCHAARDSIRGKKTVVEKQMA